MIGWLFIATAAAMFGTCFVPHVRAFVNPFYLALWLAAATVIVLMGMCLLVLT